MKQSTVSAKQNLLDSRLEVNQDLIKQDSINHVR